MSFFLAELKHVDLCPNIPNSLASYLDAAGSYNLYQIQNLY